MAPELGNLVMEKMTVQGLRPGEREAQPDPNGYVGLRLKYIRILWGSGKTIGSEQ